MIPQAKLGLIQPLTLEDLELFHRQNRNVIQFTGPRPSSADPEELVERLEAIYLKPMVHEHRARGARAVRGTIRRAIGDAGLAGHLRADVVAKGKNDEYTFAFGLENGKLHYVIEALSLDRVNKEAVREDLHATAYRFEDLR